MSWVRANLVNITIDVDGGLPRHTAVCRSRDAADMNVREKYGLVRSRGHRANPERRPDTLTVYERRACVPGVSPRNGVESAELLDTVIRVDSQDMCIVCPNVDDVADRHGTSKFNVAGCDRPPLAVGRAPPKRVSVNDGESAAIPVGCKRFNRMTGELMIAACAVNDEESISPGRRQYRWDDHRCRSILHEVGSLQKAPVHSAPGRLASHRMKSVGGGTPPCRRSSFAH